MKRALSIVLMAVMLASLVCVGAYAEVFSDVPADSSYYDAVQWAVEHDITNGTGNGAFSPDMVCSRAQVVTFLWRANGRPEVSGSDVFSDLTQDWYKMPVAWAVQEGITVGTGKDTFSPDRECSMKEILTFIWRAAGSPASGAPSGLTEGWENTNDKYYAGAVSWADFNGLLEGLGPFDKDANCTRALTVTYLYRAREAYEEITVTNAAELVAAIGPNRAIHLEPGTYDLTEYINALANEKGGIDTGNPYASFYYVGGYENRPYELVISGVDKLSIYGAGADETTIITSPRYANVLTFRGCSDITLDGFTAGHTPEGYCEGGVLNFEDCGNVGMSRLDLYGCGTYGVSASRVDGLELSYSTIHDCSYGIMELHSVYGAVFMDCTFKNCREFSMLDLYGTTAEFNYCEFIDNTWGSFGFLATDEASVIRFDCCVFDLDAYNSIVSHRLYGTCVTITNEITA